MASPQPTMKKSNWNYRSNNRYRIAIPLEPLKDGHLMDPQEKKFLEAAERGDKATMIRCLSGPNPVNVNCTNILGRSAIQIAVDNENVEIVELLLKQENIKIGDAMLQAIREGVYKIVEMLTNHPSISPEILANDWCKTKADGEESSDYPPDISPIILAAHCNQFEILQLLLSIGAIIDKPHSLSCPCSECQEGLNTDGLRYSLKRIHTYRALASPAWISLTSEDPILTAFKLSWELERLAMVENEFKEIYLELSEQCKKYSCDLLDQCRSSEEVIAVLNRRSESDSDDESDWEGDDSKLSLARVKLALKFEQKQFVTHPHCQQLLTSVWYSGLPVWRRRNGMIKLLLCLGIILSMPLISITYLLCPHTRPGQLLRSPFMKFIYHSTSFVCFLILLVLASTRTESSEMSRQNIRGPPPSFVEWLIFFWVTGMVWSECKQLWEEGLTAYASQWWNLLDFIMLSLYLATFALRAVAYFQIKSNKYGPGELQRSQWPPNDPTIIAEGIFALANVFSFARIIYLFQTNPHLGPLQISLGCMIIDIAKFFFIFFLVLTSFACGLNQLYWYYDSDRYCKRQNEVTPLETVALDCEHETEAFMTIDASYTSLLWSLFGVIPLKDLSGRNDQAFIKWIGHALLGAYLIMAMTVMINMLIAMMSRSFQDIEDHADREWKFARSKLWMGYFDEGSTLPPPQNLVISPKSIYYFARFIFRLVRWCFTRKTNEISNQKMKRNSYVSQMFERRKSNISIRENCDKDSFHNGETIKIPKQVDYQSVMKRLVSRYIHQIKKQLRQDGVSEDDLLEIKQDISSLRYELLEDRKHEAIRSSLHIDSIKRDIMRQIRWQRDSSNAGRPCPVSEPSLNPIITENQANEHGGSLLTSQDLEQLKCEIVASLSTEIQSIVESAIRKNAPFHNYQSQSQSVPLVSPDTTPSDLYQTHLFTQL
ncbi:hypothetical protein CHUAL_011965 [Chamberlinius hualienensis]